MSYTKGSVAAATDYNSLAGSTSSAAASAAAAVAKAGYLYGVGFGDRGYGQFVPSLGESGPAEPIMRCASDGNSSTGQGGFVFTGTTVGTSAYRFSQWVYMDKASSGNVYMGTSGNVLDLNGVLNNGGNPYWLVSQMNGGSIGTTLATPVVTNRYPVPGEWYLFVGVVQGSGYGGSGMGSGIGGIYDRGGNQIVQCADFKQPAGSTSLTHRTFLYYSNDATQNVYVARPRFELITGSEPSISDLLNAPAILHQVSITSGMTFTTANSGTWTKTGNANASWDSSFTSSRGYTGTSAVSFQPSQTTGYLMVGLNIDPATDNSYSSIDYAMYCQAGGALSCYENGTNAANFGTYSAGDNLAVTYDGVNVKYWQNGTVLRTVAVSITGAMYADSSFYTSGAAVYNVKFGPFAQTSILPNTVQPADTIINPSNWKINDVTPASWSGSWSANGYQSTIQSGVVGGRVGSTALDNTTDWTNLRTVLANLASWQNTSSAQLPPATSLAAGQVGAAYPSGGSPYAIPDLLATLDTNRFNYQAGNMTLTSSATSSTRATTWGQSGGSIMCELSASFTNEDQARFFFNAGGEIRIALAHPSAVTTRDADWQAVLNGLVVAFRANSSAKLGGSYGTANAVGYYQLTTAYQPILSFSSGFISPYTTNTFYVNARATSILGANGAKGYQIYFQVVLNDTYYTAQDNTVVQAGTNAVLSHLRATSTVVVNAPTCAVVTSF